MMKRGNGIAAAGLIGLFMAAGAFGQAGGEPARQGHSQGVRGAPRGDRGPLGQIVMQQYFIGRMLADPKAVADVGLSEDQLKTLKSAMDQIKTVRDEIQKRLTEAEAQQAKLMEDSAADEAAVLVALENVSKIRLELDTALVKHALLVKKTLTPEQCVIIKDLMEQSRKEHSQGDHGEGAHGPQRPAQPAGQ